MTQCESWKSCLVIPDLACQAHRKLCYQGTKMEKKLISGNTMLPEIRTTINVKVSFWFQIADISAGTINLSVLCWHPTQKNSGLDFRDTVMRSRR